MRYKLIPFINQNETPVKVGDIGVDRYPCAGRVIEVRKTYCVIEFKQSTKPDLTKYSVEDMNTGVFSKVHNPIKDDIPEPGPPTKGLYRYKYNIEPTKESKYFSFFGTLADLEQEQPFQVQEDYIEL